MKSQPGGAFINVERLDLRKYASRAPLAKVLCDYLLYHEHNPKKALELAAHATAMSDFKDWWWKARLEGVLPARPAARRRETVPLGAARTADGERCA